jgi:hypothetical protein
MELYPVYNLVVLINQHYLALHRFVSQTERSDNHLVTDFASSGGGSVETYYPAASLGWDRISLQPLTVIDIPDMNKAVNDISCVQQILIYCYAADIIDIALRDGGPVYFSLADG